MEKKILLNTEKDYCRIFFNGLKSAFYQEGRTDLTNLTITELIEGIKNYQTQIKETIPLPRNKEDEKAASLAYIQKIRAASEICLMYVLLSPEEQTHKLEFAGSLHAANNAVYEVIKLLEQTYKEEQGKDDQSSTSSLEIKLEDAWNNVLEYDNPNENIASSVMNIEDDDADDDDDVEPEKKKPKITHTEIRDVKPLAIRTKILLIGGRKPQSYLVDALKRKRAILCRSPTGSHLKLEFGKAFDMFIYFSPLLAKIRAVPGNGRNNSKGQQSTMQNVTYYNVMSVSGDIRTIGPLISKRLDYASAQATKCLRRCFADCYRPNSSDFESEILEGTALLKFLNLVRNTYCPNWVDAELD